MKPKSHLAITALAAMLLSILPSSQGGDAIAVTYDGNGNVTSAASEYSSTKAGGKDHMKAVAAADKTLTAVKSRLAFREGVIHSSDLTGFFAFAIGTSELGRVTAKVGYGKTQEDADKNALKKLTDDGATNKQAIQFRYFSYGETEAP